MTDEPAPESDQGAEPPEPPTPKRGALPARQQDLERAKPYVPGSPVPDDDSERAPGEG